MAWSFIIAGSSTAPRRIAHLAITTNPIRLMATSSCTSTAIRCGSATFGFVPWASTISPPPQTDSKELAPRQSGAVGHAPVAAPLFLGESKFFRDDEAAATGPVDTAAFRVSSVGGDYL